MFFSLLLDQKFGTWHGHAPVKINLMTLAKYNQLLMLLSSKLKLRNSVARKGNEVLTLFERAYLNLPGRYTVNTCLTQVKNFSRV